MYCPRPRPSTDTLAAPANADLRLRSTSLARLSRAAWLALRGTWRAALAGLLLSSRVLEVWVQEMMGGQCKDTGCQ